MTLAYPALVLNADFAPISTFPLSTWDFGRTFRNVLKDRVIVLEEYDHEIRAPRLTYRPPSVVALKDYVKRPDRVPFTRMNLFLRDGFRCQYCGEEHAPKDLTFDHVIPRSKGGGTNWENIVAACVPCNTRKGHRQDMRPIAPPKRPSAHALMRRRGGDLGHLHKSWTDYLYWSGALQSD
ncbi:HNH endonuclease [Defluviimonas salinarum]|uniref:HNH endonuclease n=1 Tax=Defluviimonas salinarum TaxID=2992147 RepID=A0ABT3J5E1_9RHOB|nr:HNH endonuclease [Defluviimonas salinarum]MCW3782916.1 HNH endonuclease [Defluviimonas salinarum]